MRTTVAFTALCLGTVPAMAASGIFVVAGRSCPADSRMVGHDEAVAARHDICRILGAWSIARLAEGGSMDGPGYRCGIRDRDERDLGHILCKHDRAGVPGVPVSALEVGVAVIPTDDDGSGVRSRKEQT